jgi:hypothetical protein
MKIDISKLKTIVINLEEHYEKKESSRKTLNSIGINDITYFKAIKKSPGRTGLAMSFKQLFSEVRGHSEPILICEDDIGLNPDFNLKEIDIPDDADALYVGIDYNGYTHFINPYNDSFGPSYVNHRDRNDHRKLVVNKYSKDVYRIYNMLSAHAVIVINPSYTDFLEKAIDVAILSGGHQDLVRASTMPYWKVYGLETAMLFQQGPNEISTKIKLSELPDNQITDKFELL